MVTVVKALRRDRARWEKIASSDPYYAVLSEPRFLGSVDAHGRRAFFESGEVYVNALLVRVATAGAAEIRSVAEFGCGPGRLAYGFARRGFAVTAVDVSPTMLDLARKNAEERNIFSIDYVLADDFLRREELYDLVNATLVLQRLEGELGMVVLQQLASRVAPGGLLHIQLPFRTDRRFAARAALALRRRVPAINGVFNVLRKRRADVAVLPPRIYSLEEVLLFVRRSGLEVRSIELSKENELEVATIVARRTVPATSAERAASEPAAAWGPTDESEMINVKELIRSTSVQELNRRAEQYFAEADATSFAGQLAKPFANTADAPATLINLGTLLGGLNLRQGHVVLDFGSGTGWLSRRLTEMGCRMILADVSETALRIAREHFEQIGLMKSEYPPSFLHYNGLTLDLPSGSVDRIICFDSFHHVPNPGSVLREFGRLLKPGGIAGFSEPGPNHSRSPQSQFEMRAYGVIENDIDLDEIWREAREAGFSDLQLSAFSADPLRLPLIRFKEIFRGGEALTLAAHAMRQFLENATMFFLHKAGQEVLDSRTASALACDIRVDVAGRPQAGLPIPVSATVVNRGKAAWLPSGTTPGGVWLGCHLYSERKKELLLLDYHWQPLSETHSVEPEATIEVTYTLPALEPGEYELEFDCVSTDVAWFSQAGSTPVSVHVTVV